MKCLSVRQPYAWAMFQAPRKVETLLDLWFPKDSENRSWALPRWMQECLPVRVLVHASGTIDLEALEALGARRAEMITSAILGSVLIVGCDRAMKSKWDFPGEWHFRLEKPIAFERSIPLKGKLGFFEVSESILPGVR